MKYPFQDKFLYTEQNQSVGVEGQWITVMILSFRTGRPGQTVLEEQSDQGIHCLPFRLHFFDSLLYGRATLFKF